jgi:hypothetical protein
LPQQNKRSNDGRCFEIKIDFSMAPERTGKNSGRDYCDDAVEISCANADSDQRKHIETAINNRPPGAREKEAASPENHRCCERKLNPLPDLLWDE